MTRGSDPTRFIENPMLSEALNTALQHKDIIPSQFATVELAKAIARDLDRQAGDMSPTLVKSYIAILTELGLTSVLVDSPNAPTHTNETPIGKIRKDSASRTATDPSP